MTQTQYNDLRKIPFDQLIDRFAKTYYEFYGTLKMQDIFFEIDNSIKIQRYIKSRTDGDLPQADEILSVLRSHPYFFFSRAGSRCVAALNIFLLWENKYNKLNKFLDAQSSAKLCVDIIAVTLDKTLLIDKSLFSYFFKEISTENNAIMPYQLA